MYDYFDILIILTMIGMYNLVHKIYIFHKLWSKYSEKSKCQILEMLNYDGVTGAHIHITITSIMINVYSITRASVSKSSVQIAKHQITLNNPV